MVVPLILSVDEKPCVTIQMKAIEEHVQGCCLFLTILQNEILDFSLSFELSTLGSGRVK